VLAYRPRHFDVEELVDPVTWNILGDKAWWLLDPRMLWTLDQIRERYNRVVTVNDWKWRTDKPFTMRGFRPAHTTVGGMHSQHRFGRASDFDVEGMTSEEVRQDILTHRDDPAFQHITCLETGTPHVHMDFRNWDRAQHGILLVKP
jgi:uncharacterized protein YcbK (DUF882 family)